MKDMYYVSIDNNTQIAILISNLLTLHYTYIIIVLIQNIAYLKTRIYLEYGKEYLAEAVNFRL